MPKGFFISLEGGEGAGKTTQINLLAESLKKEGHDVITTREPGGTPAAEEIRNLLSHDEWGGNWSEDAELLLFFVARSMHIKDVIHPALEQGKIIICDRYIDSTRAYQGYLHKLDMDFISDLEKRIVGDYIPDLTFLIDIPVDTVIERIQKRGAHDHYDKQGAESHEVLRQAFLDLALKDSQRIEIIDGTQNIEIIANRLKEKTFERLNVSI
ncbi:MAG: dTMP kinase [Pseudomonadota bacterium]